MIDTNVPARGAQPRDLVLEVITDTFNAAMRLTDDGAAPPQLDPAIQAARDAQRGDDVALLDARLRDIAVGAMATRVRLRATVAPDTAPTGS